MSNVYIRSQNREKLYIFGISFNSLQYEEQHDYKRGKEAATHHTICIADGCLEEIAEYESKERQRNYKTMEENERAQDMRTGQDKKEFMPNFLKDLNTEILEQLTKGSSEKNVVGLAGDVKELKAVEAVCGLRFKGYLGLVEVERPSGITDTLVVAFAWDTPYKSTQGVEFDVLREYPIGSRLLLYGKMQTLKDFSTGRQLVFVLADFVALSPKAEGQNDIVLVGEIVYKPTYRETPRGKRISDIFVKVRNQLTKSSSLIPCICWNETAEEVANWLPGDTVKLIGRLQSREYEKLIEEIYPASVVAERVTETRTAYEVSVHTIRKAEGK